MTVPNQTTTPQQPNPEPSAQGNTPSNAGAGNGSNNQPTGQTPQATPPAQPPAPLSPEQIVSLVTNAEAATGIQFSSLPAEAQRYLNSAAAAARRDGEAAGRAAAEQAARANQEREALLAREREGEVDERVRAATERANIAERERDEARADLLRLRVAMRVGAELGVQNPERYADRLRGTTEQEIEQDARSFFPSIGTSLPTPPTPPASPAGGNEPPAATPPASAGAQGGGQPNQQPQPRNREQATEAQRASGAYNIV